MTRLSVLGRQLEAVALQPVQDAIAYWGECCVAISDQLGQLRSTGNDNADERAHALIERGLEHASECLADAIRNATGHSITDLSRWTGAAL